MSLLHPRFKVEHYDRERKRWRRKSLEVAIAEAHLMYEHRPVPVFVWKKVPHGAELVYRVGF